MSDHSYLYQKLTDFDIGYWGDTGQLTIFQYYLLMENILFSASSKFSKSFSEQITKMIEGISKP